MVDRINELNPDIVFMAGDIVDEKLAPFLKQNMGEIFKKLKTKHGVYAVTGNHEFYGGEVDDIVKNLEMSGIKVLRDDNVKVADSFYVTGREDISIESYYKKKRKSVSEILANADKELPVILLDHNPRDLEEPKESGVDLQLSGHTHRGQMFPNEYFTKRLYELDWGYLKKDNFNIIVSSGIGTWGPPIRIGNSAEIVDVTIRFLK
jgi:predicted MPP superfamily phosphohydrolase